MKLTGFVKGVKLCNDYVMISYRVQLVAKTALILFNALRIVARRCRGTPIADANLTSAAVGLPKLQ